MLSLTEQEKNLMRRVATPHTIDVDVEHEYPIKMGFPEWIDYTNDARWEAFPVIPSRKLTCINVSAYRRLQQTNLYFRSDDNTPSGTFLGQTTSNNTISTNFPAVNTTGLSWNHFTYYQEVGSIPVYWRGNAWFGAIFDNMICRGTADILGVITHNFWACRFNYSNSQMYHFLDCATTQALMEKQDGVNTLSSTVYGNWFIEFVLPPNAITDARVNFGSPGVSYENNWSPPGIIANPRLLLFFKPINLTVYPYIDQKSSIRGLVPYGIQLTCNWGNAGDTSTPFVASASIGSDPVFNNTYTSTSIDSTSNIRTYHVEKNLGLGDDFLTISNSIQTRNTYVSETQLQPVLKENADSQFIQDGFFQKTEISPGDLKYTTAQIFGYEEEKKEFVKTSFYTLKTKMKFTPHYLQEKP